MKIRLQNLSTRFLQTYLLLLLRFLLMNMTVSMIINKYKNHTNVIAIKQFCKGNCSYCFSSFLNAINLTQKSDIRTIVLKRKQVVISIFLLFYFWKMDKIRRFCFVPEMCWCNCRFQEESTKSTKSTKYNHRLLTILLIISKLIERSSYKQFSYFFDEIFWIYQSSFHKILI